MDVKSILQSISAVGIKVFTDAANILSPKMLTRLIFQFFLDQLLENGVTYPNAADGVFGKRACLV
jgi:hypothetical protein